MIRSLLAIEKDDVLREIPRHELVIVGSITLAVYKDIASMPKTERYVRLDDLDISAPEQTFQRLWAGSQTKTQHNRQNNDWLRNAYHGVQTVRRDYDVTGLNRPVQLDVGSRVGPWTHDEIVGDSLNSNEHSGGYSVLNPFRQLFWYEQLGRKKDLEKREALREAIIPRLAQVIDLNIPSGLEQFASDVLAGR